MNTMLPAQFTFQLTHKIGRQKPYLGIWDQNNEDERPEH